MTSSCEVGGLMQAAEAALRSREAVLERLARPVGMEQVSINLALTTSRYG